MYGMAFPIDPNSVKPVRTWLMNALRLSRTNVLKTMIKNKVFNMSVNKCSYLVGSGPRKGQECGSVIKDGNNSLCKRHRGKQETKCINQETKCIKQETKSIKQDTKSINQDKSCNKTIQEEQDEEKNELLFVIRKNKFNNFVFKDTPYIFQSATEKYIVAKEGIKGEWIPLNDEDKRICRKQYHLRYKDIDFDKSTNIDINFIKENIKLPYEAPEIEEEKYIRKKKSSESCNQVLGSCNQVLGSCKTEEEDEKYIPKKKSGGKKVIIDDESEEKYVPKKNVNKKDNLI
jgi:hypothetical protein